MPVAQPFGPKVKAATVRFRQSFRNRSQAIETALAEKLSRLARTRLAEECAKLDPTEERLLANECLAADESPPDY